MANITHNPWFCHPDRCPDCHGTDWDAEHDVPCQNRSFCVAVLERDGGLYACGQDVGHTGPHRSGAVTWEE